MIKNISIQDFSYELPDSRVAKYPLAERDASKLLVYRNGEITEDIYRNIAAHVPAGSLMVFNQSKVVHARLLFQKPTGGVIEVFCLSPEGGMGIPTAMLQRGHAEWECLVGGAGKWKHGMVLQLTHNEPAFMLSAKIIAHNPGAYVLGLSWDNETLTFADVLHHAGKVPLPPYLHRDAEQSDETRYQTLFARDEGSVAAPTAGLHFTDGVMQQLAAKHVERAFVTLHVGAGTFKPVKAATMAGHEMHAEWIEITAETLAQLTVAYGDKKIIAVGTTSLRTLESIYWIGAQLANGIEPDFNDIAVSQWAPYAAAHNTSLSFGEGRGEAQTGKTSPQEAIAAVAQLMRKNNLTKLITRTQILIGPGYDFKLADGLVTNFHQPQSTLLLLIAAFVGPRWREIYDYALAHSFRFLSYGDGCLLWR